MSETPVKAKQAVLISGMHRSGTAAVSRAISFLGYAQPQLLTEAGPQNPRGYWQPTRIVQLNEQIIDSLGWSWDHTPLLARGGGSPSEIESDLLIHMISAWLDKAREAVRESYRADATRVVCKDPRISLFAPFWQTAFEAEGFEVKHLLAFRDPLEVADSLNRTYGLGRGPALRAWLAYNLRPLATVPVAATIAYDDLLREPLDAVNRVARALGTIELDKAAATELEEFIDRSRPADEPVREEATIARLVNQTFNLMRNWREGQDDKLKRQARAYNAALTDAQLLFGKVRRLPPLVSAPVYEFAAPAVHTEGSGERTVAIHYHLFKNAGTSVDAVLEANFGDEWREHEFPTRWFEPNAHLVAAWLQENPTVRALSSHTAMGPVPKIEGVRVWPIVFVRHPLDRIRSAYDFERRQEAQTLGAKLAKETDLAGYVQRKISRGDRQCRNFQTYRFATFVRHPLGPKTDQDADRKPALTAARKLPFVGMVEDFLASMQELETHFQKEFPEFRAFGAKENVLRSEGTLGERLAEMREQLGEALWNEMVEANQLDLELYKVVMKRRGLSLDDVLGR